MKIEFICSLAPRQTQSVEVDVPEGNTLLCAMPERFSSLMKSQGLLGAVWGRAVPASYVLQAGDRVELLRELEVDPKTARRERFKKQGVKKAGLFKTQKAT